MHEWGITESIIEEIITFAKKEIFPRFLETVKTLVLMNSGFLGTDKEGVS